MLSAMMSDQNADATPAPRRKGARGAKRPAGGSAPAAGSLTYADAGVDLETYDRFIDSLPSLLRRTHTPRVIANDGGFAGLFRLDFNERLFKRNYKDPVLVACTDGVGTKVKLAAELGLYDTVGIDLVAMSVNDLIVQGAEPLFFLDYVAVSAVDPRVLQSIIRGISEGCRQAGCALLGGETAEMPDVYAPGEFDLAGFAVGVVELKRVAKPTRVQQGDVVIGLASSGIHSNGYSLVRRIVSHAGLRLDRSYPELTAPAAGVGGEEKLGVRKVRSAKGKPRGGSGVEGSGAAGGPTLGEVLMTPTRIYAASVLAALKPYRVKQVVSGMAHITGGGLAGNLERALPPELDAVIDRGAWEVPPIFRALQSHGNVEEEEMRRVFNMGIGYAMIVRPAFADAITSRLSKLGERVFTLGKVVKGKGQVRER